MPETNFTPTPYQALVDAGFSPEDARKAIGTITAEGYDLPYQGPRKAYIISIAFQTYAHSIEHAEKIVNDSGIHDGPCEIRQDGRVLKVDYLNIEGMGAFREADWNDYRAYEIAEQAGVLDAAP